MLSGRNKRYLLLEAFVVLFGVLAALLVDEARENATLRSAAEAAQQRVIHEARQNLAELVHLDQVVRERLASLRALRDESTEGQSLADLLSRFQGFRTPDLSSAAWERLSRSALADSVDYAFLEQVFRLQILNRQYTQLDQQINALIYSELFYLPEKLDIAIKITERIKSQQIGWAMELIPMYEEFLQTYDQSTRNP